MRRDSEGTGFAARPRYPELPRTQTPRQSPHCMGPEQSRTPVLRGLCSCRWDAPGREHLACLSPLAPSRGRSVPLLRVGQVAEAGSLLPQPQGSDTSRPSLQVG